MPQITSLAGIPQTAIHMSRAQFYSCLKLIAAHQAGVQPLRVELIAAAVALPLPKFSWTSSPTRPIDGRTTIEQMANGSGGTTTHRGSVGSGEPEAHCSGASSLSSSTVSASLVNSSTAATLGSSGTWRNNGAQLESQTDTANSDLPSTDSEVEPADEAAAGGSRSKDKVSVVAVSNVLISNRFVVVVVVLSIAITIRTPASTARRRRGARPATVRRRPTV